jgi:hypothetical protein
MENDDGISAATPAIKLACNEIFQDCCATAVLAMQQIGVQDAPIVADAIDKGQLQFIVSIKSRSEYTVSIQVARPDAEHSQVYFYSYKEKHSEVN